MAEIVLEASDVGKEYLLQTRDSRALPRRLLSALRLESYPSRSHWAVRRVSLAVPRGGALGIIGPNGSGKTTLLALLAGLLTPSEGSVTTHGRINPFLQLFSGLHGDLPVIDNIRLCAALFGMTARQLETRLDAIVDFAQLEPYLPERLFHLSSGFMMRIPFVTALYSDLDILVMDEVFTVGDMSFSRRCLQRMKELRGQGKTIVLATHQIDLVRRYCTEAIYLEDGAVAARGAPLDVIRSYLARYGGRPTAHG